MNVIGCIRNKELGGHLAGNGLVQINLARKKYFITAFQNELHIN